DDDGLSLVPQLLEEVGDHPGGEHVQAVGGLVVDDDVRVVDDGDHQGDLLLHPGGEVGDRHLGEAVGAEPGKEGLPPRLPDRRVHLVEVGEEGEEVVGGEKLLQLQLAGEESDVAADLLRLAHHADAVHQGVAAVGADQGGQHPQGGGLASPVGAQQAEDLPLAGAEAQVVHRHSNFLLRPLQLLLFGREVKGLGQALDLNDLSHRRSSSAAAMAAANISSINISTYDILDNSTQGGPCQEQFVPAAGQGGALTAGCQYSRENSGSQLKRGNNWVKKQIPS